MLEAAVMMKECGNAMFKDQDHSRAKLKYLKAIRYLEHEGYEPNAECKALLTTCQLNLYVVSDRIISTLLVGT